MISENTHLPPVSLTLGERTGRKNERHYAGEKYLMGQRNFPYLWWYVFGDCVTQLVV